MTRERCAAAAGEQREPVAQAIKDLFDTQDSDPYRGKLDGERQPVESAAHGDDISLVRGGELERTRCSGRPLGEQHDGLVLSELGERCSCFSERNLQRRDGHHVLARHLEQFSSSWRSP